jgi:hypothetical protein
MDIRRTGFRVHAFWNGKAEMLPLRHWRKERTRIYATFYFKANLCHVNYYGAIFRLGPFT